MFENELYEEARRICEEALAHDPYEEQFHLRLLQSLVMGGNKREAKAYYEQACSILYEEYGISPSQEMLRLYQQIEQPGFKGNGPVDLANIQFEVETRDTMEGAYFCDPSVFMCVYSLERRRGKRSGVPLVLGSLNIDSFNGLNEKQTRESLSVLKEVLANTLRRGDVVCEWNESQFVILLTNVRGSDAEKVFRRIASRYMNRKAKGKLLDLKMWYRLIKD